MRRGIAICSVAQQSLAPDHPQLAFHESCVMLSVLCGIVGRQVKRGVNLSKNHNPNFAVRHEGGKDQWMRVPRKQLSVQLGSYPSGRSE